MTNYIVAYMLANHTFKAHYIVDKTPIKACETVIPQFKTLTENLKQNEGSVEVEKIYANLSTIGVVNFQIIALPELYATNDLKAQVIAYFDTQTNDIDVLVYQEKSKRDALLQFVASKLGYGEDYYNLCQHDEIREIILNFSYLTGIRVYQVDTLRALIKESIEM